MITFDELWEIFEKEIPNKILKNNGLSIFAVNRAKFEEIKDAGAVAIELNAKNEEERSKMLAGIQEKENLGNSGTPETEDVIMNKVMDEINNKR